MVTQWTSGGRVMTIPEGLAQNFLLWCHTVPQCNVWMCHPFFQWYSCWVAKEIAQCYLCSDCCGGWSHCPSTGQGGEVHLLGMPVWWQVANMFSLFEIVSLIGPVVLWHEHCVWLACPHVQIDVPAQSITDVSQCGDFKYSQHWLVLPHGCHLPKCWDEKLVIDPC